MSLQGNAPRRRFRPRLWARFLVLLVGMAAMTSVGSAYYYWMFIGTGTGASVMLPGRFDLNALQDSRVYYFISNQAPVGLVADDSQAAVYSQIQKAAEVWNAVGTSALRLRFGGISDITAAQSTPGIDVVFDDDMPPGILAQSKPSFPADLTLLSDKATAFVPILRSRLQLRANLAATGLAQPSYADSFFLTLVHEFGHTLGLQHSMTSAVMATSITRAAMKGSPLAADDIAAISTLYPAAHHGLTLANVTGSIAGRVTVGGNGVNLASVVALSAGGSAVNALTNPDGSYRIDGIPPGSYYVYAHPLPPAQTGEARPANIVGPVDLAGGDFSANTGIDTRFYPGTQDWTQAGQVAVAAGQSVDKIDFQMAAASGPTIHDMQTYGYRVEAMPAPPLKSDTKGNPIVFIAPGTAGTGFLGAPLLLPGLAVSVIGGAAQIQPNSLRYYTEGFLLMYVDTAKVAAPTPVALSVTLGQELYVLPAAFTIQPNAAPEITSLAQSTADDGTALATIVGSGLVPGSTQILFDGATANLLAVKDDGSWVVAPPVAPSAQQATVEAVNPDGQTSILGLSLAKRPIYSYAQRDGATLTIWPQALPAGTDSVVVIEGKNTNFAEGRTFVGFGNSDVSLRRLWVINPGFLAMNVSLRPGIALGPLTVTVATDVEVLTDTTTLKVVAAGPQQISLLAPVINAATGLAGVPSGGTALVRTTGLPQDAAAWTVTVGAAAAPFTVDKSGTLAVIVPDKLAVGPQAIQLTKPDGSGPQPVIMQLDAPPPVIVSAFDNTTPDGKGAEVTAAAPANAGDTITLTVSNLQAAGEIWINFSGAIVWPTGAGAPDKDGNSAVAFVVPSALPYDATATEQSALVMIGTGTRISAPFTLLTSATPPKAN